MPDYFTRDPPTPQELLQQFLEEERADIDAALPALPDDSFDDVVVSPAYTIVHRLLPVVLIFTLLGTADLGRTLVRRGLVALAKPLHWQVRKLEPHEQSQPAEPMSAPGSDRSPAANLVALRRAIIGQESGGKFNSVNPHSGALGYAQLMPANVKAWGKEALGYAPSKRQFLSQPEVQLRIVNYKLRQYWQQELQATAGDEHTAVLRVASRWYSGNANLYTSTRPQYYRAKNGQHYRYPSIASYSRSVWRQYQQQSGQSL